MCTCVKAGPPTLTHSSLGASMASYDSMRPVASDSSWCWVSRWRRALSTVDTNCSTCSIYTITSHTQWWRRLVNAYEVKTGTVYLQRKSCVIHTRALQWFSQRGAIQIFVPLPSHLGLDHTTITQDPPPAQNDTVHSYNMAYPTTSTGFCIDYNYYFITWNVCNVQYNYWFYWFWFYCIVFFIQLFSYIAESMLTNLLLLYLYMQTCYYSYY